jgi:apolipoprotein N-acyltransferase
VRIRAPRRSTWLRLLAAVASGVLAAFSRPSLDIGPLAWIALVPLFCAWRTRRPRACAGYAFLAGAVYYTIVCSWIWYFGAIAIVPFVIACAGYWALAGAVIGWLRWRRAANPFVIAAVWVLADAAVARFPVGGFSWGELGYAFHDSAPMRAVASVGGLTLVTFLAVAFNALVADLLVQRRGLRPIVFSYLGILLVGAVVVGATITRADPKFTNPLRVALVQGNDKNRELTDAELDARYLPNSHFALATRITDPVDLIVFPESSMDGDPRTDPFIRDHLAAIAREHDAWVLANATVDADPQGKRASNLDVLFGPDGEIDGTYAKRHLVPFGEYVPFRSALSWIRELQKVPRDFEPGPGPVQFDIAGTPVAPVICFESAFGYQIRPLVKDGAQAIVVSTNNRSYRRSANSEQHLAFAQMRAAETGRPVVQAAISGISAVVDADGVVHGRTELFQRTVLETTLAATTGQTPYVRYGEWAIGLAVVIVVVAVVIALVRRRRDPSIDLTADEVVSIRSRIAGYGGTTVPDTDEPVADDAIPETPVVEPTGIAEDDQRADDVVKPIHEDISSE